MAAGNVGERGVQDGEGESLSGGDAEETGAGGAVEELVGADGRRRRRNESERAEEFGGEALGKVVHGRIVREECGGERRVVNRTRRNRCEVGQRRMRKR